MSREKKPHDWPVLAGVSEIRPSRGLGTRMGGSQVPGPSHKSEGICQRVFLNNEAIRLRMRILGLTVPSL